MELTLNSNRPRVTVMTIELKPDQEKIIRDQLASGRYRSVDELLDTALSRLLHGEDSGLGARSETVRRQRQPGKKSLAQLFAESPFKGLSLNFERDPDTGRSIEL
jgi:Arc/MetJ-type ribon-helix-helix transcriptional regulator